MIEVTRVQYPGKTMAIQYEEGKAAEFMAEVLEFEKGADFSIDEDEDGRLTLQFQSNDKWIGIHPGGWVVWDQGNTMVMSNGTFHLCYAVVKEKE